MILTILRYTSVLLVIGICAIIGILVMRKNSHYIGNICLTLLFIFMAGYGGSVFATDYLPVEVKSSAALGYCFIFYGVVCLFLSMQCIVKSTAWIREKWHVIPLVIYSVVFTIIAFIIP